MPKFQSYSGSPGAGDTTRRFSVRVSDLVLAGLLASVIALLAYRINDVLIYRWDWARILNFVVQRGEDGGWRANLLLEGFANTLRLAIWTLILSSGIGVFFGVLRTRKRLLARLISGTYVGMVRNIPPLVLIFVFYFFLSSQILKLVDFPRILSSATPETFAVIRFFLGEPARIGNFLAGVFCLSLFSGAYLTEIIRAGLQSIPVGQNEAARALGLSRWHSFRFVVLPQALRKVLPPIANQFVTCIKDSSLVSLISIPELTFMASDVTVATGRIFETWLFVAGVYFVLCFSLTRFFAYLERRNSVDDRSTSGI